MGTGGTYGNIYGWHETIYLIYRNIYGLHGDIYENTDMSWDTGEKHSIIICFLSYEKGYRGNG